MQLGRVVIDPGVARRFPVELEAPASSLVVSLAGAANAWRFRFYAGGASARGVSTGPAYLGSVRSLAWLGGESRIIAILTCPGAQEWWVDGRPQDHTVSERANLDFCSAPCCTDPGVSAIPGISLDNARALAIAAGVNGAVSIPDRVLGWTALADTPADATVSVALSGQAPVIITIPAGGAFRDFYGDYSGTDAAFIFTGTKSYVITREVSGPGVDAI